MSSTANKSSPHVIKRWILLIGIFLLVQGLFVGLDNTIWQPNINDSGSLLPRIMRGVLESTLFMEKNKLFNPFSHLDHCVDAFKRLSELMEHKDIIKYVLDVMRLYELQHSSILLIASHLFLTDKTGHRKIGGG